MDRSSGERDGMELGILYVLFQLINIGISEIPYVTLFTIIWQVVMYMRIIKVPWTNYDVCINVSSIISKRDYTRLILSVFEHTDDMHLYYNMMSYLLKGQYLEKKYGSKNFFWLLVFLSFISTSLNVILSYVLSNALKSPYLMNVCAIGFSGVLHALKVIIHKETAHLPWGIAGFPMSPKYLAWAELIIFHIITPDASFVGHLAGVLTGILYTNTSIGGLFDIIVSYFSGRNFQHNYINTNASFQTRENSS